MRYRTNLSIHVEKHIAGLQHNVIERDERPSPTSTMLTGLMHVFL